MSELDFAAQVIPRSIKILAVTGTNGKSTVVTFVGQVSPFLFYKKMLPFICLVFLLIVIITRITSVYFHTLHVFKLLWQHYL